MQYEAFNGAVVMHSCARPGAQGHLTWILYCEQQLERLLNDYANIGFTDCNVGCTLT
jgi:hypothetical protein